MTVLAVIVLVMPIAIMVFMSSTFVAMIAPRRAASFGNILPKQVSIAPPPMQPAQNVAVPAPTKLRAQQTLAMRRRLKSTGRCTGWIASSKPRSGRQEQRRRSERPGRRA